jgi:hypothetical protein
MAAMSLRQQNLMKDRPARKMTLIGPRVRALACQLNSLAKSVAYEKLIRVPFGFWHRFGAARHIEK